MKCYKFLNANGKSSIQGHPWNLPVKNSDGTWTPGEWMPHLKGKLVVCKFGYHLCRPQDVLNWLNEKMYEAEYKYRPVISDDKIVVRQARLLREIETYNDRTIRLFAVWCARQALALVPNPDPRSIQACDVAERFANGEATPEELTAAWAAARDAARDAAWDAARDAARDAAWDAAWAAAWDAAWDAARDAQTKKLFEMLGEE